MTLIKKENFSSYAVGSPPYTFGPELWDGTYDSRYIGHTNVSFINNADARTTRRIPVTAGKFYCFSGGNRCRLLWEDAIGHYISASDEGNTGDPITIQAPPNAKGVYYYYHFGSAYSSDPSVTEHISGFLPIGLEGSVAWGVAETSGDGGKSLRGTVSALGARLIAWEDQEFSENVRILTKVRTTHRRSNSTSRVLHMGVFIRQSGHGSSLKAYALGFYGSSNSSRLEFLHYNNSLTPSSLANVTFAWVANTDYNVEVRAIGPFLRAKVWEVGATKPADWTISHDLPWPADTYLQSGKIGFLHRWYDQVGHYYEYDLIEQHELDVDVFGRVSALAYQAELKLPAESRVSALAYQADVGGIPEVRTSALAYQVEIEELDPVDPPPLEGFPFTVCCVCM